jgi:3-hydroxy-3-methylglutaryl CoA synthase
MKTGIHEIEVYTPGFFCKARDLEKYHDVYGKYTEGLMFEEFGFCDSSEDVVSMALTAVSRIMENINYSDIGAVFVGSESFIESNPSIHSEISKLWMDKNLNIAGSDVYHACYGGTAALFNAMDFVDSKYNSHKYALAVATDISDSLEEYPFMIGAACVVMLIGGNAPLVIKRERFCHVKNTYDFYKPIDSATIEPIIDGKYSVQAYNDCLCECLHKYKETHQESVIQSNDHFLFHLGSSPKFVKHAFRKMCDQEEKVVSDGDFETLFTHKVWPSLKIARRIGSQHTAALYTNLLSLLIEVNEGLIGKKIALFSFGSGSMSTFFQINVLRLPKFDCEMHKILDERVNCSPQQQEAMQNAYKSVFRSSNWIPSERKITYKKCLYLIDFCDEKGRRFYKNVYE